MRLTAQGSSTCACERNSVTNRSTYEWGNSKKRNQLGTGRAEKHSFSIISLLKKCEAISNGFVLWDLEMIIDEPDDNAGATAREPARSSPRLAASRSHGGRGADSATARATACCDGARPHGTRTARATACYRTVT
jgi:hypothetical protein